MIKLRTILAGTAVAMFTQFAAAQANPPGTIVVPASQAPSNPNDPAYTDQSRLNQTNDPFVKKRVAVKEAKMEYKAEKKEAKMEYKADKKAAKEEYKQEKKEAVQTRNAEVQEMRMKKPVDPGMPAPASK